MLPPLDERPADFPLPPRMPPKRSGAVPTREIGSLLGKLGRPHGATVYEQVFRVGYNEAWTDPSRTPSNPTTFEIGVVSPKTDQAIIIMEYEIVPYVFSGIHPHDFQPLGDELLSGTMGVAIKIDNGQSPNLNYQLQPTSSTSRPQEFARSRAAVGPSNQLTADDFDRIRARSYGGAAGFGNTLMPPWKRAYGPTSEQPFWEVVNDEQNAVFSGAIYYPMTSIVPFIQLRVSGMVGGKNFVAKLVEDIEASVP